MSELEDLRKKVSELEETIKTLEKDLIHDKLTGLKTRAFFEDEAKVYFDVVAEKNSRRSGWFGFTHISFVFIDIDNFKDINDSLGHLAGDKVLKAVSEILLQSVRDGDTATRWGGDELAITLVGATERDAVIKAEDIRKRVEDLQISDFPDLQVTLSIGVASAEGGISFEEVLHRADEALYASKRSGRNRVTSYSQIKH